MSHAYFLINSCWCSGIVLIPFLLHAKKIRGTLIVVITLLLFCSVVVFAVPPRGALEQKDLYLGRHDLAAIIAAKEIVDEKDPNRKKAPLYDEAKECDDAQNLIALLRQNKVPGEIDSVHCGISCDKSCLRKRSCNLLTCSSTLSQMRRSS